MSELEQKERPPERPRLERRVSDLADIARFVGGLIVLVLAALMIAEGVLGWVTGASLFFEGVNPSFKFAVGFISIILAASVMSEARSSISF